MWLSAPLSTAILNHFTPEQWQAIGILGGLAISGLTSLASLHFQRKDAHSHLHGSPGE
ncbi:phage holin [Klebsiella variicola]